MGDAAGQRADAFEALDTQQMRFEFLLLGYVRVDDENRFGRFQLIPDQRPTTADRDSAAVLAIVRTLTGPFSILDNSCSCRSRSAGFVFIKKIGRFLAIDFRGRPTIQFFSALIPKFDAI